MASQQSSDALSKDREREFYVMQFNALRGEILGLRRRIIQLLSLGITGIPLVVGAGERFDLDLVVFVSPLITVVFALMLLFEQNSIMRIGRYIRLYVEPKLGTESVVGWEKFLEMYSENRSAERFFALATHITFAIYYLGGTAFAFIRLSETFGITIGLIVTALYIGVFSTALGWVIRNFPTRTTYTRNEHFRPEPEQRAKSD